MIILILRCCVYQIHYLPEEPFIEELEGGDVMEFPPPPEPPLEDEAVIPPRVIDQLLDASDHEILASLNEVCAGACRESTAGVTL